MKKVFLFVLLLFVWLWILFPRECLWDTFVWQMQKRDIKISAKSVDMSLFFFYDKIEIDGLNVSNMFEIKKLDVVYAIWNPFGIDIKGISKFGSFSAKIWIAKRSGVVYLKQQKIAQPFILRYFKKTKNGYSYEFHF